MDFYRSLAPWYDMLFPLDPAAQAFVAAYAEERKGDLLVDAGCGTGTMLAALAPRYPRSLGFDLDPDLLDQARRRLGGLSGLVGEHRLLVADLRDLASLVDAGSASLVLCLGNTLPHLTGHGTQRDFLAQALDSLAPGGMMIFQTINFDRIFGPDAPWEDGRFSLPTLEAPLPGLRMERWYGPRDSRGILAFHTRLHAPVSGGESQVPLRPLFQTEAEIWARELGARASWFGGFDHQPWSLASFLTIGVWSRSGGT